MVPALAIELALDHKPSHREMTSRLISVLYLKVNDALLIKDFLSQRRKNCWPKGKGAIQIFYCWTHLFRLSARGTLVRRLTSFCARFSHEVSTTIFTWPTNKSFWIWFMLAPEGMPLFLAKLKMWDALLFNTNQQFQWIVLTDLWIDHLNHIALQLSDLILDTPEAPTVIGNFMARSLLLSPNHKTLLLSSRIYVTQVMRNFTGALLMTVFLPSSFTHTRDMSRWFSLQFKPSNMCLNSKLSGARSQEGSVQSRHTARHEARAGKLTITKLIHPSLFHLGRLCSCFKAWAFKVP